MNTHESTVGWLRRCETALIVASARHGVTVMRFALAVVFLWFGGLKVVDQSPVAELVMRFFDFAPPRLAVATVGWVEIAIGLGLLYRPALRVAVWAFCLHMLGTFSLLVRFPDEMFRGGDPLLLTELGEFVVKNLVFLAAGLVIAGSLRRTDQKIDLRRAEWPGSGDRQTPPPRVRPPT